MRRVSAGTDYGAPSFRFLEILSGRTENCNDDNTFHFIFIRPWDALGDAHGPCGHVVRLQRSELPIGPRKNPKWVLVLTKKSRNRQTRSRLRMSLSRPIWWVPPPLRSAEQKNRRARTWPFHTDTLLNIPPAPDPGCTRPRPVGRLSCSSGRGKQHVAGNRVKRRIRTAAAFAALLQASSRGSGEFSARRKSSAGMSSLRVYHAM